MSTLYPRIKMKTCSVPGIVPSIPISDDPEDGTWLSTDIAIGEFFINTADNIIYLRTGIGLVNIVDTINNVLTLVPTAQPTFTEQGMLYSDSVDTHLYYYDGSNWKQLD